MSTLSILAIKPVATSLVPLNHPVAAATTASSPVKPATVSLPASAAASATAPSKTPSAARPASTGNSPGSGGSGSSASSTTDETYSTTVGGKSYSGTVQYSDGQYVVSVPGISGAVATGSSAQSAEDNLGNIISVLA